MDLVNKETEYSLKRNDSCNCNSTGFSSVQATSDEFPSWQRQKYKKSRFSSSCSSSSGSSSRIRRTETCLIDLKVKSSLTNFSNDSTSLDTSTLSNVDEDLNSSSQQNFCCPNSETVESTASPPARRRQTMEQRVDRKCKSSNATQSCRSRRGGRSCLINVTMVSYPDVSSRPGHRNRQSQRRRTAELWRRQQNHWRQLNKRRHVADICASSSDPLRALDTSSEEGDELNCQQQLGTESSLATKDTDSIVRSTFSLTRKKSTSHSQIRRHLVTDSSGGSSSQSQRSVTGDETPSDSAQPKTGHNQPRRSRRHQKHQQKHQKHRRVQGKQRQAGSNRDGNNANNTDNHQLDCGDYATVERLDSTKKEKAATMASETSQVLDAGAGDTANIDLKQILQRHQVQAPPPVPPHQSQQQLFTRTAASNSDGDSCSYKTVSTHCIDPWLPELEATGTLDGCTDNLLYHKYSSNAAMAAACRTSRLPKFCTTTTQSATPSESSQRSRLLQPTVQQLVTGNPGKRSTTVGKVSTQTIEEQLMPALSTNADFSATLGSASAAEDEPFASSDQLIFRAQLEALRRQLDSVKAASAGGRASYKGSSPELIPGASSVGVTAKRLPAERGLPKFDAATGMKKQSGSGPSATKAKRPPANQLMKPKVIKKSKAVQSFVPLPRPAQKLTTQTKKPKADKLVNPQQQQPSQQKLKKQQANKKQPEQPAQLQQPKKKLATKAKIATKKSTTSSSQSATEVAPKKPTKKAKLKVTKSTASVAQGTTKVSSAKRASGTKFVTFSRPVYI